MKVNGVIVKRTKLSRSILMALMLSTVRTVVNMSNNECSDCGCDIDDHNENFCMNCGDRCEMD